MTDKEKTAVDESMKVNEGERWMRLILGSVVLLFVGIIYAWSIIRAPFLDATVGFNWAPTAVTWNYTITIICFSLGGFFAGLLAKKISARIRLIVAAALLCGGFLMVSTMAPGVSIWVLYLAYGIMSGLGVGITYLTIIGATNAWFPDKRGLASGILMMCFALTSLTIGKLAGTWIASPTMGWSKTYMILGIALGVVVLIAAFFVAMPKPGTVFPAAKAVVKKAATAPGEDMTASQMIKRGSFWKLFVFCALLAAVGSAAIALVADIFLEVSELDLPTIATWIGIVGIFNGLGRLTSGWLFDNLGMRTTQYITSAVAIGGPAVVVLGLATNSLWVSVIGVALCFFSYGFAPTTSSVFASTFYGMKNFALNFSVVNLFLIFAPFAPTLMMAMKSAGFDLMIPFAILAGAQVIGLIINLTIKKA